MTIEPVGFAAWQIGLLSAVALALVLYPLVMRWLSAWAQPYRLRMAELGRELLGSPHLDDVTKRMVDSMLDDAFDWTVMPQLLFFLPRFFFRALRGTAYRGPTIKDEVTRAKMAEFQTCHARAVAAANPLFSAIFTTVIFSAAGIFRLFGRDRKPIDFETRISFEEHIHRAA
ncbi:MAG TPA: hypothetical protein VEB20_04830 [Azospirillaceae bacterium]|nr:hypothetical protein [Azospirillaceae bacterium]